MWRMVRKPRILRLLSVVILCLTVTALWPALTDKTVTSGNRGQQGGGEEKGVISTLFRLLGSTPRQIKVLGKLADIVQARLQILQNPQSCQTARLVLCSEYQHCGLGCQLHHVTYCLLVAYATNRTLVWKGSGMPYTPHPWWGQELLPLSQSCPPSRFQSVLGLQWSASETMEKARSVFLPNAVFMQPTPKYLPPAIPADLAPELLRHHSAPSVWWVGQFVSFLLRLPPDMLRQEQELKRSLKFSSPVVGIHVRRGDKLANEAQLHDLGEYMMHVEKFYQGKGCSGKERKILLASDDPAVLKEAPARYPDFTFLKAPDNTYYSPEGLVSAILTLRLLSQTDHLVCTFSSNICRAAYEFMQAVNRDEDAGRRVTSVDSGYYFHGQQRQEAVATQEYKPESSDGLALSVGDRLVLLDENTAFNSRTNHSGHFPIEKVRKEIPTVSMPTYSVT